MTAANPTAAAATPDAATIAAFLKALQSVPLTLTQAPTPKVDTAERLGRTGAVTVLFPPCADELLALIRTTDVTAKDPITQYFDEYFRFGHRHRAIEGSLTGEIDKTLLDCGRGGRDDRAGWPSQCCAGSPCVTLDGHRGLESPVDPPAIGPKPHIRRLFVGDLVWLFYFERMGIFQILGAILDAYACNGRIPISNGSIDPGVRDDIAAVVLEIMTRQVKSGLSSAVRDRACAYRTSLGWMSDSGRKLNIDAETNTGFNTLFHKLVYHALEFYRDKRLAVAIQGTAAAAGPPSVATLITISDTIDLLKKRFEAFAYGRNYTNTLSGIVWAIGGMAVIRELRTTLGIPTAYNDPHEYIPAAYDLLVAKRTVTQGDSNRYLLHRECARNGRDILLDLEVLAYEKKNRGEELDNWLTQIEAKVEGYRTAYRGLTGVDLGVSATPVIEQQA